MGQAEDIAMNAAEKMKMVNEILQMTAKKKHCKVEDLQWKADRHGNIHTRIRKNG